METIVNGVKNLVSFLNPLDWIPNLVKNIAEFFVGDGENSKGVFGFLKDIISSVGSIFSWLGKFFDNLLDFFTHIFVPNDSQWQTIKDKYSDLGDLAISHLPFVANFYDVLEKQNLAVSNSDMLVINMPEFNFFGVKIASRKVVDVREAYEPYRQNIRTGLTYIVFALGIVYIIKYIVGWGQTQANTDVKESSQYMSWSRKK